jgi:eukaryotic-like serine/threonine-protein kinase
MPVSAGTRLGPFEILAPLGAGGMGEVYRARDTRLGREVAIKVLPPHLAATPEARARFEREARAASALNHPNICALYDVGREGDTDYLVLELLEGRTLAERIAEGGALPLAETLAIGAQIADALERAHREAIVHRDLKPGNVMLTRAGAKLLDFGLARAGAPQAPGVAATIAAPLTAEGTIVGTFQYMAPEQLEGREADARCDLWALGCVLYEMASGRRAFAGASQASVISAILRDTPRPLGDLVATSPPALDRLVRACLAKDRAERWQSAGDAARTLRWIAEGVTAPSAAAPPRDVTFQKLTFRRGSVIEARFALDGHAAVYSARWTGAPPRVFLARLDNPETSELALPDADLLAVSRSGQLALSLERRALNFLVDTRGVLAQAPLFGGTPREIARDVHVADWAPDGRSLAVVRKAGIEQVVEYPIGNVLARGSSWLNRLRVSPDGERVAYFAVRGGKRNQMLITDSAGNERRLATLDHWPGGLVWRPDGREIIFGEYGSVEGAAISAIDVETGSIRRLLRLMNGLVIVHDLSAQGDLLVVAGSSSTSIAYRAPGQKKGRNLQWFDLTIAKDLSEDGRTMLIDEQGVAGAAAGGGLWCVRTDDDSAPIHVGSGLARTLSPDGRWAAASDRDGRILLLPTGADPAETIDLAPLHVGSHVSWYPDGRSLMVMAFEEGRPMRLYRVDRAGGAPVPITPEGVAFPTGAMPKPMSADGRRFFAVAGDGELLIHDATTLEVTGRYPLEVDESPVRWNADGTEVYLSRRGDVPVRTTRLDLASGRRVPDLEVAPLDPTGVFGGRTIVLTADGQSYATTFTRLMTELYLIRGLA